MADDQPNISSSRVDAGDVARHAFGTVRRGFDPHEVRAYLEFLGKALDHANRREQELLHLLQEAEERARHPVIDESVLTSSLGQRSAAVLRGAHEEAARILSQAEEAAAAMVRDAQQQATDLQVNAESSAAERIAEAELEANSLRQQAREEAAGVVETARVEGEAVVERARDHGRAMLDQAQEARRRVLADMAHRRRLVTEQIEQFRAARDEIAGSVVGVRRSIDRIVEDLSRADDSARAAAAGANRSHGVDAPESELVEEGERVVAELGELDAVHEQSEVESASSKPRAVLRFDDIATVVERPQDGIDEEVRARDGAEDDGAPPREPAARGDVVHDWQEDPAIAHSPAGSTTALVEESPAVADPHVGGADVDGLFARLRARHLVHETTGTGATERTDVPPPEHDAGTGIEDAHVATEEDVAAPTSDVAGGGSAERADVVEEEPEGDPSPDAPAFAKRSKSLDPIATTLARRLKRALQDDQNRLLDRLRQGTGGWTDDLLLDVEAQQVLYTKAAADSVRDAMASGTAFARSVTGGRQSKSAPDQRAVEEVSGELASTVTTLLRRRLEGGEIPDAAERIGAAYREWRGERIERLAEDSAVEAFSRGVLAGAGKRSVRWSRSEVGPGCADCEDNALAGSVVAGEEFPTGHRHPPAHAGCRCLVLPTPS
ncbi:MAG TPA: DivIVA domain-containing protein [Acidimicrobiales bacterium]|nr:DivIVA domain-containing protein [Acidimicrobiales bacterium]